MAQKQSKKQTETTYRSIAAFKKHFFPNAYEKEVADEKSRDPKRFGTGLVHELLENVRQELRR